MRHSINRVIAMMLAALMLAGTAPAYAAGSREGSGAGYPQDMRVAVVNEVRVNDAIAKFTDSMNKLAADTSKMSNFSACLTRFGGLTSAASGTIGILQMIGILKDPMVVAFDTVINEVKNVQDQLKQIDAEIKDINDDLVKVQVEQKEIDRNRRAEDMRKYWRDFNTDYCEPLDDLMAEYEKLINRGIRSWWSQKDHEGVRVNYTMVKDENGENVAALTYSNKAYDEGFPLTADNGEAVEQELSFGVPAGIIPELKNFNIDTYHEDFVKAMAPVFVETADAHKLDASDKFYSEWDMMGDAGRRAMSEAYAEDILNTQIYRISCDVMSSNEGDDLAVKVMNAYRKYCDNVLKQDSGVNAMLNAMYLTHGFEGEIRGDIETFCDGMTAQAGVYGQFALACAAQDSNVKKSDREKVQEQFADTVIALHDKKDLALTGYDNFCYITGTSVELGHADAKSSMKVYNDGREYTGYTASDWSVTLPSMVDNVLAQMLYHQYQTLDEGQSSFAAYLHKYKVLPNADYSGNIMTKYRGAQTFALNEGIKLKKTQMMGSYFNDKTYYTINTGNSSKIEDKYFRVHDKLLYDSFNVKDGTISSYKMKGARALYGESHGYWYIDEAAVFYSTSFSIDLPGNKVCNLTAGFDILKMLPRKDMNGVDTEDDPFFAYDSPVLDGNASGTMGPVEEDLTKPVTGISLKAKRFTYTGKIITPAVTVKAGKETVPAEGYDISYMDNKRLGVATVTVTGKGDYSGSVSKTFKIIPKGTSIRKVTRKSKTSVRLRWERQAEKMPSSRVTGYQIRYSTNSSMKGAKKVNVAGYKKTAGTIKGLKKNKKYYFQIRTYKKMGKRYCFSKWSGKVKK